MSSSPKTHCLAAETPGSAVKVDFGEVTATVCVLKALSDCQSLPPTKPLIDFATLPSRISAHLNNEYSTVSMLNQDDVELLTDAFNDNSESSTFKEPDIISEAISSCSQGQEDHIGKIKDLQVYLDRVKKIVKPGCSQEMLEVALSSMSLLVKKLSVMTSKSKL